MPSTLLFANNNEGRVYALSTSGTAWREFLYLGLEFKKISVVPHFMWAIGGDRQVYVHVHGLDVPIRIKEEAFENERWLPIEGFSSHLLPTDRYHFSNADGTVDRNIDKVRLPSMAWQWEGEWQLDLTLEGQPLDHDGWTYAVDFPATYHPQKNWKSCVRRRKWIRFRRYCALNSWCAVAPLHKDPTQEPFIDVSIGGSNVPGSPSGLLLVWAVTAHGRVMFRSGVSTTAPEGLRWTAVTTPSGCEVSQIAVGATGLVWAVLYNGRAIVRAGVTRDALTGSAWLEVKPPGASLKIVQVAIGTNSVWCVTNDNHVWFRRGVRGEASGVSEDAAIGSSWVEMVGNISHISVAANDQVFAVGSEDRALYFRSGVSSSDPTGKKWRLIQLPMQLSRTSSNFSFSSRQSGSSSPTAKHRSLNSLYRERLQQETMGSDEGAGGSAIGAGIEETSRSAPTANIKSRPELWNKPELSPDVITQQIEAKHVGSLVERKLVQKMSLESMTASSVPVNEVYEISGKQLKNSRAWSPVRSVGSVVGTEAHPETDSIVFEVESSRDSGVFGECEDHGGSQNWTDCGVLWVGCSAGAVTVDPHLLPNWFHDSVSQTNAAEEVSQSWRMKLLEDLKNRLPANDLENGAYAHYEKAIAMSSWVKSGEARCAKTGHPFEDCLIELEWVNNQECGPDSGTLTVLNSDGITTKMQLSLSEITAIMCCSEPGSPRLAIHAPRLTPGSSPLKLQFSGDTDLEDWSSHLTSVCCQINEVQGRPAGNAMWITSGLGDVFAFDPTNLQASQWSQEAQSYRLKLDLKAAETPYLTALYNGMLIGSRLEITGFVYDDADQIRFDLQAHPTVRVRHKPESQRNIPLHINPRFNENLTVFNSMLASQWNEDEIRDRRVSFAPGAEFKLEIWSAADGFRVRVNEKDHPTFHYRSGLAPDMVCSLYSSGRVKILHITYDSPKLILPLRDVYWRQIGGHMKRVISCKAGVVWGLGYDNTVWLYTGGWGGTFLKGLENSTHGVNPMTDTQNYYIYENQRWNPLSGFSSTGLPTDRHMWSDITGKHKRSKEHAKLLSMHWQWISDWMVDFHNPGGVDRDGWQYAVDFPASYHAKKQFTDYVRRRRWYRKCRLTTSGPWQEIGNTKIVDASLQPDSDAADCSITAWAIGANGDVLLRRGVSQSQPAGTGWEHVPCDQPLISISIYGNKVWAIGKNGAALMRCGITVENTIGTKWQSIEAPGGVSFKQISVGKCGIWVLDTTGRLAVRKEINETFPEGSHWQLLQNILNDPPHYEGNIGFKNVSVGDHVFAVSQSGYVCKRSGVTPLIPAGTGWILGIQANWNFVNVTGFCN
ncbi:tectonin beta-propeller repeat-containing protein [Anopheles bellator]|uniref:tectonin beta-propeller repeat-containing protein n=1 Tax=Anopheles bellator TaxID=139047 RepID=UPI002647973F|nr:tectonin beta-propeller repeat-containing protein [Anopheles bellator]